MMDEERRADYIANGADGGDPGLDRVRAALADPVTWSAPPSSVADAVLAEIRAGGATRVERSGAMWRRVLAAAAGMAAVLLVVVLVGPFGSSQTVTLAGTELEPAATGTAVLEPTGAGWSIRLDLDDLPPAGDGYYYEGWVWSDEGDGVSIGTFHLRDGTGPLHLWAGVDVEAYPSIWISRQAEGGGAGVSDEIVMRGRLGDDDGA